MRTLFASLTLLLLIGCGYKPTSVLTQNILGNKIYVEVAMSKRDPKNSVSLKDAVSEAVVNRFKADIVAKENAQTLLYVKIKSFEFLPIIYDRNGYVTNYKTLVTLFITTIFADKKSEQFTSTGEYDFPIEANSVISDTKRYIAIKNASFDALDEYMAYIGIKGLHHGNHHQ